LAAATGRPIILIWLNYSFLGGVIKIIFGFLGDFAPLREAKISRIGAKTPSLEISIDLHRP